MRSASTLFLMGGTYGTFHRGICQRQPMSPSFCWVIVAFKKSFYCSLLLEVVRMLVVKNGCARAAQRLERCNISIQVLFLRLQDEGPIVG